MSRAIRCIVSFAAILLATPDRGSAAEKIPILAWGGPPADQTTPERFRELADAGFTHNYSGYSSVATMLAALDIAGATGLRAFASLPQLQNDPEGTARQLKDHPALAGYYLRDEPGAADFPALAEWEKRIRSVDPEHPCYINLFPNYATAVQLGAATYREHVERFVSTVPVKFISFDHYPVIGKSLRGEWYENLEQIAEVAGKANKPFWAFVLATAHAPYPIPTIEHLRLQAFSNLAYGAQGIQYFTYWTPTSTQWDFHEGPIDAKGQRTIVYDRVKQVNAEIQALASVFAGAKVVSVGHTGGLPRGTRAYQPEAPVVSLKTSGLGAAVATIEKNGRRHLVVVNRDFNGPMPIEIAFDPAAKISEVKKDASIVPLANASLSREVGGGDIVVFVWETAAAGPR
jgi:hypothetical protein